MSNTSSFSSMQEVINIQNNVLKTISGQIHTKGIDLTKFIKEREISELEDLKTFFLKQERNFYVKNNINDYRDLCQKINFWNESGIVGIRRNQTLVQKIKDYLAETSDGDFFNNINNFVKEDMARLILDDALEEGGMFEEIKQELADISIEALSTGMKGITNKKSGFFSIDIVTNKNGSGAKSFKKLEKTKGITITKNPKKGTVKVHFTHDIPKNKRDEILTALEKKTGQKREGTSKKDKYNKIADILRSYLAKLNLDEKIYNAFINTLKISLEDNQQVNFAKNSNVIYGALDELYAAAFADFFGFSHRLTGYDIQSINSKEIPVDIIFKGAGVQIKSYYEKNGIVGFNQHFSKEMEEAIPNSISLYSFITGNNQLQLSNPEVFGSFYFSEVYNRYNKEIAKGDLRYKAIENRFDPIRNSIETYSKSALDKLLNFNHDIYLKNPDLITEELRDFDPGRPAFFFINEKPIPTSAMIDDIIEGLRDGGEVLIKIKDFDINTSSFSKISERWPDEIDEPNVISMLKDSKVQYRIEVNVDGLMRKALSKR